MASDAMLFIFSLLDEAALLFLAVYFIITLSDLECDYINATTCCSRLNPWVLVEIVGNAIMPLCFLLTWHYWLFLMTAPLTAYVIYRYIKKPSGSIGIYDPTEIHNRSQLKGFMKEAMIKLGYHLIFFFIYLYCMIVSLIDG